MVLGIWAINNNCISGKSIVSLHPVKISASTKFLVKEVTRSFYSYSITKYLPKNIKEKSIDRGFKMSW